MAKTTEEYQALLLRPEWFKVRAVVLLRDKFKCRKCNRQSTYPDFPNYKRGLVMNVHHTKYIGENPWDTPMEFLITFCEDCHGLEHTDFRVAPILLAFANHLNVNSKNGHINVCPIEHTTGHTDGKEAV